MCWDVAVLQRYRKPYFFHQILKPGIAPQGISDRINSKVG